MQGFFHQQYIKYTNRIPKSYKKVLRQNKQSQD